MSKNKKPTKLPGIKKTLEKTVNVEDLNGKDLGHKAADKVSNKLDNMFDFSANGIKEKMQSFINAGVGSLCGSNPNSNYEGNIANNMMTNLSNNIRHNFEQNMELSQDLLKCKTAADFIEFQRKRFETNYKNTVKLCNDLFYDIQGLTNHNINAVAKYVKKD
jgi:hypothetical protein